MLIVSKEDAKETTFYIGGSGISRNNPDFVAIQVVNTLFGGRFTSMLNDELRVNSGLTYGASSRFSTLKNGGSFYISTFTALETTKEAIDKALEVYLESETIPCTSCNYCMPCPHGVEIPKNFTNYNKFAISKNKQGFVYEYEHNLEFSNADFCISCGECVELCPQQIQIPDRMNEISSLFVETKNK